MTDQEYVDRATDAECYADMLEEHPAVGATLTVAGCKELAAVLRAFVELVKRDFPELT